MAAARKGKKVAGKTVKYHPARASSSDSSSNASMNTMACEASRDCLRRHPPISKLWVESRAKNAARYRVLCRGQTTVSLTRTDMKILFGTQLWPFLEAGVGIQFDMDMVWSLGLTESLDDEKEYHRPTQDDWNLQCLWRSIGEDGETEGCFYGMDAETKQSHLILLYSLENGGPFRCGCFSYVVI